MENTVNKAANEHLDTLQLGIYVVYDKVAKSYEPPVCIPVSRFMDYFKLVVNDVASKYYGHESDYQVELLGYFDSQLGIFDLQKSIVISTLDYCIDYNKRNLQTIVQVLNFLPSGYFKMSAEQKQDIQNSIDKAIVEYVAKYVAPDLDVNNKSVEKIVDIYNRYDAFSHMLKVDNDSKLDTDSSTGYGVLS